MTALDWKQAGNPATQGGDAGGSLVPLASNRVWWRSEWRVAVAPVTGWSGGKLCPLLPGVVPVLSKRVVAACHRAEPWPTCIKS